MTMKQKIIDACIRIEPDPEHGPEQYSVVIDHIIDTDNGDYLLKMRVNNARDFVLDFMNIR
jgi:hypothetical protein